MRAWGTLLDPADVQRGRSEVDLIPSQVHEFRNPQAVAIGHQDHGGVPMPVAVALGRVHELLDLGLGQVFAGAKVAVTAPFWRNYSFYILFTNSVKPEK